MPNPNPPTPLETRSHQVERALYGGHTTSGAIYRLLSRSSLTHTTLALNKKAVPSLVTADELAALLLEFESSLPLDARGRVRQCTLVPVNVAVTLAKALGRGARSIAFLTALQKPIPRLWELQDERERNQADMVEDLVLNDEIAQEEEMEAPLHAELLHTCVPYETTPAEQEAVKVYKLERVPPALEAQLDAFRDWRLEPLNYQRTGNAVVDVTAANDRATAMRYLAYCQMEKDLEPSLAIFGRADLPDLVQSWLQHATERGLMWSTLSNYVSSLINVTSYVWEAMEVEQAALDAVPQPPDALLNLRSQCENLMRQQQLYARKPSNWLEWDKAQEARVKCATAWANAGALPYEKKLTLLKEYLVLLFHTVMPPDVRETPSDSLQPRHQAATRTTRPPTPPSHSPPVGSVLASCASCDGTARSSAMHLARIAWT